MTFEESVRRLILTVFDVLRIEQLVDWLERQHWLDSLAGRLPDLSWVTDWWAKPLARWLDEGRS